MDQPKSKKDVYKEKINARKAAMMEKYASEGHCCCFCGEWQEQYDGTGDPNDPCKCCSSKGAAWLDEDDEGETLFAEKSAYKKRRLGKCCSPGCHQVSKVIASLILFGLGIFIAISTGQLVEPMMTWETTKYYMDPAEKNDATTAKPANTGGQSPTSEPTSEPTESRRERSIQAAAAHSKDDVKESDYLSVLPSFPARLASTLNATNDATIAALVRHERQVTGKQTQSNFAVARARSYKTCA